MKNTYLLGMIVSLSAFTTNVIAADAAIAPPIPSAPATSAAPVTASVDPTAAFFIALSSCTPGTYIEKNILSADVGQQFLTQQIIGSDQDICKAQLTTPDNRTMTCAFPMAALTQLTDPHFLRGIVADATDTTDPDALTADKLWSQLKMDNCNFQY